MNITGRINQCDMINGYGLRVSFFVSGCEHGCKDCFSKETWNRESGYEFDNITKEELINLCSEKHIDGISILGGDPLASYNYQEIVEFCKEFKNRLPFKTIYVWTGYSTEHVLNEMIEIVELANVIITEKFDIKYTGEKRRLLYRGSSNQKYIINGEVFDDLPAFDDKRIIDCTGCSKDCLYEKNCQNFNKCPEYITN